MTCPSCPSTTRQVNSVREPALPVLCQSRGRTDTPAPTASGYDATTRQPALRLSADGPNLRRSARHLGMVHQAMTQKALYAENGADKGRYRRGSGPHP